MTWDQGGILADARVTYYYCGTHQVALDWRD